MPSSLHLQPCPAKQFPVLIMQIMLTKCKKIVGIHLSSHLSNAKIIKNKLYSTFNIPSYCLNWKGEEE